MKSKYLAITLVISSLVFAIAGCGGGGGATATSGTVSQPPSITTQPSSNTFAVGSDAQFTVNASGTDLSYQWQENSGTGFANITDSGVYSGATTAILTIKSVTAGMSGFSYRVVVSGSLGSTVTSNSANLTTVPPTKATLTLNIPSLPSNTLVSAMQMIIHLPAGVSPATFTGTDATASINFIGGASGSLGAANYNSSVNVNTISFGNITLNAFGIGDFLTVNCKIDQGTTVKATDFTLSDISISSLDGNIPTATAIISSVKFAP